MTRDWLAIPAVVLLASCNVGREPLRVCADPNNLPFSNTAREGFENRIATLVARDLNRPLEYVWWAQRRGAVRETVGKGRCEVWMGVPATTDSLATSRPYYRSSYTFVSRRDRSLTGLTFDDPRLRRLKVGVQLVGDDGANTPPADALARRGLVENVRGYPVYGDYREKSAAPEIMKRVADGSIDVALVWGPVAGYWAAHQPTSMRVEPVVPWLDQNQWPMAFDVAVGVRQDNVALLKAVNLALQRHHKEIERTIDAYSISRSGTADSGPANLRHPS